MKIIKFVLFEIILLMTSILTGEVLLDIIDSHWKVITFLFYIINFCVFIIGDLIYDNTNPR